MKNSKQLFLTLTLLIVFAQGATLYADSSAKVMEMTLSVRNGSGANPMIVVWLETDTGDFVKTLRMFSAKKAHYRDMLAWLFKSRKTEERADVDAVSGATIRWNRSATIHIPAQIDEHDLLDGSYVLRIESRKESGHHYRRFQIPIPAEYSGGVHEHPGYVESVKIAIKDKAE